MPLGYQSEKSLKDLMTLKRFITGETEGASAKVLVCVKSIGAKKKGKVCRFVPTFFSMATHSKSRCLTSLTERDNHS